MTSNSAASHGEKQQRGVSDGNPVDSGKGRDSAQLVDLCKQNIVSLFIYTGNVQQLPLNLMYPLKKEEQVNFIWRFRLSVHCVCIEYHMWLLVLTLKHRVIL